MTTVRSADRSSLIFRHSSDLYPAVVDFLAHEHGYEELHVTGDKPIIRSKASLAVDTAADCAFVVRHLKAFRRADRIVAFGYAAIPVMLLARAHVIKPQRIVWFAFMVHDRRMFPAFRILLRSVLGPASKLLVFSRFERSLYAKHLGVSEDDIVVTAYGSWADQEPEIAPTCNDGDSYFFSGGATNRDHLAAIEVFRDLPDQKLVVAGSRIKNPELHDVDVPSNVTVLFDIPSERFEALVRGAAACILLMQEDTGASGQETAVRCMRHGKVVIASDTAILREYIANGESGFLVKSASELPPLLDELADEGRRAEIGLAANRAFVQRFSRKPISDQLAAALEVS